MHFNEYEVGGCVRDTLLGRRAKDVDVAMELRTASPLDVTPNFAFKLMREDLEQRGFRIFKESPEYFTIRAHWPEDRTDVHGTADFVLCRKDGPYSDGRRPDYVEVGTLGDDLARRDFTMNAIARSVGTTDLCDPYGGVHDIEEELIRCVGDPMKRFAEDPLRVVRALRFAITLGFAIEVGTWQAIHALDPELIVDVARERRRDELEKMFRADTLGSMDLFNRHVDGKLRDAIFAGIHLRPTFTFKGQHAGRPGASDDQDQDEEPTAR